MRLVAWNCNMALHRKFDALYSLRPDVAIICECAEPDRLRRQWTSSNREADLVWVGANPNKGLAVLAFNEYSLHLADEYDPSLRFIAPVRVDGPVSFNLVAIWAQNFSDGIRRKDQAGPFRLALDRYQPFLTRGPCVVAGDFNNSVIWDKPDWPKNHADAVDILDGYGLVSALSRDNLRAPGERKYSNALLAGQKERRSNVSHRLHFPRSCVGPVRFVR